MAKVTTLAQIWWPLMDGPSVETPYCCVCGARYPLNRHHVVKRSAGNMYRNGVKLPKPTVMLCGSGNASGCHGKAHAGKLHFRFVKDEYIDGTQCFTVQRNEDRRYWSPCRGGHWEFIEVEEPCKYQDALKLDGWERLHTEDA